VFATTEFFWKRKKKQNKQVEEEEEGKKKTNKKNNKKINLYKKCKSVSKTTIKGATTTANNALTCRLHL
tara:strand:+ start:174 stop:380 length:207 start_codon:yes stop_codon:yes gene_type:complete